MQIDRAINTLLEALEIHPVLVDIGASGESPKIWQPIARNAIYIGFDPDLREIHEIPNGDFYKAVIINQAVTDNMATDEVAVYLTQSPYCSSTLKPDAESLANFLYADLFTVERQTQVKATTLQKAMTQLSLSSIDWLKIDSQGTDLRIFKSLLAEVRSRVLTVQLEPGLMDTYIGEDLFPEVHEEMLKEGFWLSRLDVHGAIRMRKSTLDKVVEQHPDITYGFAQKNIRQTPGWVEATYFRTTEMLKLGDFTRRDYLLLWAFALLDNQLGFALDLTFDYEEVFGADDHLKEMRQGAFNNLQGTHPTVRPKLRRFRSLVRNIYRALQG